MSDEDKTFSGSFGLDLRIWWRQAHTLHRKIEGDSARRVGTFVTSKKCKQFCLGFKRGSNSRKGFWSRVWIFSILLYACAWSSSSFIWIFFYLIGRSSRHGHVTGSNWPTDSTGKLVSSYSKRIRRRTPREVLSLAVLLMDFPALYDKFHCTRSLECFRGLSCTDGCSLEAVLWANSSLFFAQ